MSLEAEAVRSTICVISTRLRNTEARTTRIANVARWAIGIVRACTTRDFSTGQADEDTRLQLMALEARRTCVRVGDVTLREAMSSNTDGTGRAAAWRARKQHTEATDAGIARRAVAVRATLRRIDFVSTRWEVAIDTYKDAREDFSTLEAGRASVRIVRIARLVAVSVDTYQSRRTEAILITRQLYTLSADAMEALRAVYIAVTADIRYDWEARWYTKVQSRLYLDTVEARRTCSRGARGARLEAHAIEAHQSRRTLANVITGD